jgi:hypothetical protein
MVKRRAGMGSIEERLWLLKKLGGRTSVQGSGTYYRFCPVPGLSVLKNWVFIYKRRVAILATLSS